MTNPVDPIQQLNEPEEPPAALPLSCMHPLKVRLASPRGFCAGVSRAIRTVEEALEVYGAPVYVRHEIVHNAHVVSRLRAMGAIFIDELSEAPDDRPVILSAHGAPRSVYIEAAGRQLNAIDATCPLVLKVHNETRRWIDRGYNVLLIGHAGHPEVIGTMGQAPQGRVTLIETPDDVADLDETGWPGDCTDENGALKLAYVTQTTLSVDETSEIIDVLRQRFPSLQGPRASDICYATTNRQAAVKATAPGCDVFYVVGHHSSSNSLRLVEVAKHAGAKTAILVENPTDIDWGKVRNAHCIGVSAGASAPEELVEALLEKLAKQRQLVIEPVEVVREDVTFKQPLVQAG